MQANVHLPRGDGRGPAQGPAASRRGPGGRQPLQEPAQIVRHVVHVRRRRLPGPDGVLHRVVVGGRRVHEHRRHAERVRRLQVVRHVFEHGRAPGLHVVGLQEGIVGRGGGLRHIVGRGDVEDALEQVEHAELAGHVLRVPHRSVGEDQLASGECRDRLPELGMLGDRRQVDVVHVVEERLGVHAVHQHHAGERGAELAVVALLQMPRVFERHAEVALDVLAHALVHLREQVAFRRIERVVEIEDPDAGLIEPAHGLS